MKRDLYYLVGGKALFHREHPDEDWAALKEHQVAVWVQAARPVVDGVLNVVEARAVKRPAGMLVPGGAGPGLRCVLCLTHPHEPDSTCDGAAVTVSFGNAVCYCHTALQLARVGGP